MSYNILDSPVISFFVFAIAYVLVASAIWFPFLYLIHKVKNLKRRTQGLRPLPFLNVPEEASARHAAAKKSHADFESRLKKESKERRRINSVKRAQRKVQRDADRWQILERKGYTIEPGADLKGFDLSCGNLSAGNLFRANLTGADLSLTFLSGANLCQADLTNANLTSAYMQGANLIDANLTSANLTGANLTGANLTNANLTGAVMPDGWQDIVAAY
jgi:hypothetical protein